MHKHIKQQLETRLSTDAITYLNEQFQKIEQDIETIKELESKVDKLLTEVEEKDQILWSLFQQVISDPITDTTSNVLQQRNTPDNSLQIRNLKQTLDGHNTTIQDLSNFKSRAKDLLDEYVMNKLGGKELYGKSLQLMQEASPEH